MELDEQKDSSIDLEGKHITYTHYYLEKNFTSTKIANYFAGLIAITHVFLIMFMGTFVFIFIPIFILDRYTNEVYEECKKNDIKPEYLPYCCDHTDPEIGMNCTDFLIQLGIPMFFLFIIQVFNTIYIKNTKKSIILFLILYLINIIFLLIYIPIGTTILYRSNYDCYKIRKNARLPYDSKYSREPVTSTTLVFICIVTFFILLGVSLIFPLLPKWIFDRDECFQKLGFQKN